MWALPALMALALLPTVKNMLSGVCLSFPAAGTASIIRAVKTVQSLTIVTEWRITEMGSNWKLVSVCPHCGGRLTISIFYSFSRDHAVKLDGKLGKKYRKSPEGEMDACSVYCKGCHTEWDADHSIWGDDGVFIRGEGVQS